MDAFIVVHADMIVNNLAIKTLLYYIKALYYFVPNMSMCYNL